MKKLLLLLLVLVTPSLFAQDGSWRDRGAPRDHYNNNRDNAFELSPFVGYRRVARSGRTRASSTRTSTWRARPTTG